MMLSEKQKEMLNRSIGYLECLTDLDDKGIVSYVDRHLLYDMFKSRFKEVLTLGGTKK